jgi:cell division protein FtsW (lipid II flippase)
MILPEEVYKRRRRHNNTPESILLIIANYIVVSIGITLFTDSNHVHWFFWVIMGLLALYNFFTIRRNLEEFNKITIIAYVISLLVLVAVFFLYRVNR